MIIIIVLVIMTTEKILELNRCRFCSFQWHGRVKNPRACPACKRYHWKEDENNG